MKVLRYNSLTFSICNTLPNFKNIVICQIGAIVPLTSTRCAMQDLVMVIFRYRAPAKVRDVVVCLIPAKMATPVSGGWWPDKGYKYQGVNMHLSRHTSTAKFDSLVATGTYPGNKASSLTPRKVCPASMAATRKNGSVLCDCISRETGDLPETAGDGRIYIRHGSSPMKSSFVEKPVSGTQYRAGFVYA